MVLPSDGERGVTLAEPAYGLCEALVRRRAEGGYRVCTGADDDAGPPRQALVGGCGDGRPGGRRSGAGRGTFELPAHQWPQQSQWGSDDPRVAQGAVGHVGRRAAGVGGEDLHAGAVQPLGQVEGVGQVGELGAPVPVESVVAARRLDGVECPLGDADRRGGHVHDPARSSRRQAGQQQFGQEVRREVVDEERRLDAVPVPAAGEHRPDIVDQDRQPFPRSRVVGGDSPGEGADVVERGQVGGQEPARTPRVRGVQQVDGPGPAFGVAPHHRDRESGCCQAQRRLQPDAAGSGRDHGCLPHAPLQYQCG